MPHDACHRFWNATKPSRFAHFWQGAESLAPATQNHIWTFKSGPNMWCFLQFDLEMCFAPQPSALFQHLNFQKCSETVSCLTLFDFETCFAPQRRALCRHLRFQKCSRLKCFVHFDLEMCFAPQWHAYFRHVNFQKCSEPVSSLHFWLRNVLRATTAYTFSTSHLPKVFWTWCALYILTSKCAWRHNGVHFFDISTSQLPKVLRTWGAFSFFTCKCASLAPHPPL